MQVFSLRDLYLLRDNFQKNEAIELLGINFTIAMVFIDIPVEEGEEHVTITGYGTFAEQEEDGH